jgi:V/A-type H+/Na+-transporting ATPase subunit I
MPWRDVIAPVQMARVALVAPERSLRDMLVVLAAAATVEIDDRGTQRDLSGQALHDLGAAPAGQTMVPALAAAAPDLDALERSGRRDLLAGEAELQAHARAAVHGQGACALAGWIPASHLAGLAARLAGIGCAVVPLPYPPAVQAPTLLPGPPARRALAPLVSTYWTVLLTV